LLQVHDVARPYTSSLRTSFPVANRGVSIRKLHLRSFLAKQRDAQVPFLDVAADWQFLIYCAAALDCPELIANLCGAVASRGRSRAAKQALERAEKAICEAANLK
jgi:hypothetical protein